MTKVRHIMHGGHLVKNRNPEALKNSCVFLELCQSHLKVIEGDKEELCATCSGRDKEETACKIKPQHQRKFHSVMAADRSCPHPPQQGPSLLRQWMCRMPDIQVQGGHLYRSGSTVAFQSCSLRGSQPFCLCLTSLSRIWVCSPCTWSRRQ